MKTILVVLSSFLFCSAISAKPDTKAPAENRGTYRHVVLFKFKDTATKEQVAHIEKAFAALPQKINSITDYEWGTNVSPENHAQGLTHCFIVSFKDKAGLEEYLPHEAHKAFVKQLLPILDKVVVVDFVAKKN